MNRGMHRSTARGFTMIEMVVAIAITALLLSALAGWLVRPTEAFVTARQAAQQWQQADLTLELLSADLRAGLPNSVRIACGGRCIEVLRVVGTGEYRAAPPGDALTIGANDDVFDTLTPLDQPPLPSQWLVIGGLTANATPPFGVYASGTNTVRAQLNVGSTANQVQLIAHRFPAAAPDQRFHVVGGAVSYLCAPAASDGVLRRRSGYGILASQPTNTALGDIVARDVTDCRFSEIAPNQVSVEISHGAPGVRAHDTFTLVAVRGLP